MTLTKTLAIVILAAAATPALAQFGPEYSSRRQAPASPNPTASNQPAPQTQAPPPAPQQTKGQKISTGLTKFTNAVGPWVPALPEDDPANAAAGYVPPQDKASRGMRKGARWMQKVVGVGQVLQQ